MTNPWPNDTREAIEAFFGRHTLTDLGKPTLLWESQNLVAIETPPLRLSWALGTVVRRVRCHVKVAPALRRIFDAIEGLPGADIFGGCYEYRRISGGTGLSLHSWGAAVDIDPANNRLGTVGQMHPYIVAAFDAEGWRWGGRYRGRLDPMHFEALARDDEQGALTSTIGAATDTAALTVGQAIGTATDAAVVAPTLSEAVSLAGELGPLPNPDQCGAYGFQLNSYLKDIYNGRALSAFAPSAQEEIRSGVPRWITEAVRQRMLTLGAAAGIHDAAGARGYYLRRYGHEPWAATDVRKLLEWWLLEVRR